MKKHWPACESVSDSPRHRLVAHAFSSMLLQEETMLFARSCTLACAAVWRKACQNNSMHHVSDGPLAESRP